MRLDTFALLDRARPMQCMQHTIIRRGSILLAHAQVIDLVLAHAQCIIRPRDDDILVAAASTLWSC